MPPDSFLIKEIQLAWVLQPEDMGGKRKFWYRQPEEDDIPWLFKYPRGDSGEHWAEKIAAEVAGLLEITCAPVQLATFQGVMGSSSRSFLTENQQLFHGNQVLARIMADYDLSRRFNQSNHTLENIRIACDQLFVDHDGATAVFAQFAEFLVLDALIGNTDRHHENWGIVVQQGENGWEGYLAPSFDHASSLGRELEDRRREHILVNDRLINYSERASGGIYWSEHDGRAPSPLEIVRKAFREYPDYFESALSKLAKINERYLEDVVSHIPNDWMSSSARRFAIRLICCNCELLQEI